MGIIWKSLKYPVQSEQFMCSNSIKEIWIIEDDTQLNKVIERSLRKSGYNCRSFFSGQEVLQHIASLEPGQSARVFMLLDYLLDDMNALELLKELADRRQEFPFIIMTGCGDEKTAVELMKNGAMDYVIKENRFIEQIIMVIKRSLEKIETLKKLEQSRLELEDNAIKLEKLNKQINLQKLALESEKSKTDKLLQSILPKPIARELLEKGYSKPRHYDSVSILFADVIGFSDLAKKSHPIELVTSLDNYFYVFDEIVEQHGMEKIKTIGDCYMCAGGIPEVNENNALIAVLTGLKIQETTKKLKEEYINQNAGFQLRLGIHTGEVVAGVVGKNKFAYDIWGDAVNVASRIVEAGKEGKVNISEKTYEQIKEYFICTKRGEVITKRNHPIKMYFVERLKPEFSAEKDGITPNAVLMDFLNIKQHIRYY